MNKRVNKTLNIFIIIILLFISHAFSAPNFKHDYLVKEPITKLNIHLLPITDDWRNYFLLQSIDDSTNIIIGDFVGSEKMICLIMDKGSDGKKDKIIEYYPDSKIYNKPDKPATKFYTTIEKLKKQIIEGTIYKTTYSYKMGTLNFLKHRLKRGRDIFKSGTGYIVKIFDPDRPSSVMGEYYFAKKMDNRYDLVFTTYYYLNFRTRIAPELYFSVYCRNSKDPYVAKIVNSLLKMIVE